MAVSALSSVKSGPPNSPACCPVTIATAPDAASRCAAACASGGASRAPSWAARTSAVRPALPAAACRASIARRQLSGAAGSPGKNGASRP